MEYPTVTNNDQVTIWDLTSDQDVLQRRFKAKGSGPPVGHTAINWTGTRKKQNRRIEGLS